MGACLSAAYSASDEVSFCQQGREDQYEQHQQHQQQDQDQHELQEEEEEEEQRQHEVEQKNEQVVVYNIVHNNVEYDITKLYARYAGTVREIQESICAIFGVMLVWVKTRQVFDTSFDFYGWLPRTQHPKLEGYKSLLRNLDGLAASYGEHSECSHEPKALRMVAYSFHVGYFENLACAFKLDLLSIRVWCAGLDCTEACTFNQLKMDRILDDNTKWFLEAGSFAP